MNVLLPFWLFHFCLLFYYYYYYYFFYISGEDGNNSDEKSEDEEDEEDAEAEITEAEPHFIIGGKWSVNHQIFWFPQ